MFQQTMNFPENFLSLYAPLGPVDDLGITAHQAPDFFALWHAMEQQAGTPCDVPFWAAVWPGARLMARYILQTPELCSGKSVLDFGAGGAVASIAAALAGARSIVANDIDPVACRIAAINSAANRVSIDVDNRNILSADDRQPFDTILLADMFYQKAHSTPLRTYLKSMKASGTSVFIADGNRPFTPKSGLEPVLSDRLRVNSDIEGCSERAVTVYRMVD